MNKLKLLAKKTAHPFLRTKRIQGTEDLYECSTVNNRDMKAVLEKVEFDLLVLVGDIYQIESIRFGNWFSTARGFLPNTSVYELTIPYRSHNPELQTLWDRVRNSDRFSPLIYNNIKGWIAGIEIINGQVQFNMAIHALYLIHICCHGSKQDGSTEGHLRGSRLRFTFEV